MGKNDKNEAASAVRSLDELDRAVKITTPGIWMVLLACFALLAGILAWGFFGTVSAGVSASGIMENGKLVCILDPDEAELIKKGDTAVIDGKNFSIEKIGSVPLSRTEAKELLGSDYLVSENMNGDWALPVTLVPEDNGVFPDGSLLSFKIVTGRISPVSMIWKDI
ncbi:MAG: hypothetical protein K6F86_04315 [Lachnospiraceae bacterium]|nr:hypothetical protein [Lachnospiraceae bacterium]